MGWNELTSAVVGGLVLVVGGAAVAFRDAIVSWLARWAAQSRAHTFAGRLHLLSLFHRVAVEAKEIAGVDGFGVFAGHNCGGLPLPGKAFFITSLDGWSSDPKIEHTHGHQIKADTHLLDMATRLVGGDPLNIVAAELPDCKLKSYYRTEHVGFSRSFFLGVVDDSMLYISFYGKGPFPEFPMAELETLVDRLKAIVAQAG